MKRFKCVFVRVAVVGKVVMRMQRDGTTCDNTSFSETLAFSMRSPINRDKLKKERQATRGDDKLLCSDPSFINASEPVSHLVLIWLKGFFNEIFQGLNK